MKNKLLIPIILSLSAVFYACSEADLLDTNSQSIADDLTAYTDSLRSDKVPVDTVVELSSSESLSSGIATSSETTSSETTSSATISSATSSTTQSSATQSSTVQSSSSDVVSSSSAVSSVAVSSSTASGTCSAEFNPTTQKPGYNTNEEVSYNGNNYRACSYATEAPSGSNTFPQGETCKWDNTIKWLDLGPCS